MCAAFSYVTGDIGISGNVRKQLSISNVKAKCHQNLITSRKLPKTYSCEVISISDHQFLPERDYVTFGYMLSQIRLSSVVCLPVVCRLQRSCTVLRGLNLSAIFLRHCVAYISHLLTSVQNFTEIVPKEPLRRGVGLNARRVTKQSNFGPDNSLCQKHGKWIITRKGAFRKPTSIICNRYALLRRMFRK